MVRLNCINRYGFRLYNLRSARQTLAETLSIRAPKLSLRSRRFIDSSRAIGYLDIFVFRPDHPVRGELKSRVLTSPEFMQSTLSIIQQLMTTKDSLILSSNECKLFALSLQCRNISSAYPKRAQS